MGNLTINDILITNLNTINTAGGNVLHGMKNIDNGFKGFGEAYFSFIEYGKIKAWKKHTKMTLNLIVPVGKIKFVFYSEDFRNYRTETIGDGNYVRLTVPPNIWFGFQGLSKPRSLLMNISDILHDPTEAVRLDINYIDFK